jgi:hypothetical protein
MAAAGTLQKVAALQPAPSLGRKSSSRQRLNPASFSSAASISQRDLSSFTAAPTASKIQKTGHQKQVTQCVVAPERPPAKQNVAEFQRPDAMGRFGKYGGKYVPETLMYALSDLEKTYKEVTADPAFQVSAQDIITIRCLATEYDGRAASKSPLFSLRSAWNGE